MNSSSMNYSRFQTITVPIQNVAGSTTDLGALMNLREDQQNFPSVRWMDMIIAMTQSLEDTNEKGQWIWDINAANMVFNADDRSITYKNLGSTALLADKDEKQATCGPIDRHHPNKKNIAPELKDASKRQVVCNEKTQVYGLGKVMAQIFKTQMKDDALDAATRQSIAAFLKKMTDSDPDQRPTLDQVKKFYKEVRENLLNTPALLNRVAMLNVNEYANADSDSLKKINHALKDVHEVWLYDDKTNEDLPIQQANYQRAFLRLQEFGLTTNVNKQVIMKSENSTIGDIAKVYSHTRELEDNNLYVCGTINHEGAITYPEHVSIRHLDKVIKSLESDLDRIKQKYQGPNQHQTRKGALEKAVLKLNALKESGQPIKYADLMADLNRLQSDLTSKHLFRRVLSSVTDSTFHASRENVKQLIEGIEETTAPRPQKR